MVRKKKTKGSLILSPLPLRNNKIQEVASAARSSAAIRWEESGGSLQRYSHKELEQLGEQRMSSLDKRSAGGGIVTGGGSLSSSKTNLQNINELLHKPNLQVKTLIELNCNLKETSQKISKNNELLWRKSLFQPEERNNIRRAMVELSKRLEVNP